MEMYLICRTRVNTKSFIRRADPDDEDLAQAVLHSQTSVRGTFSPTSEGEKRAAFRVLDVEQDGERVYVYLMRAVPLH